MDLSHVDLEALARDVAALRKELFAELSEVDRDHLLRLERVGRAATAIGLATAWMGPNPASVLGLAIGRGVRWMLMHHVGHRGYDRVPGMPERLTSRAFARGARRLLDWPDWILPEAWVYEHNVLHHSFTNEEADPDLIERNVAWVQRLPRPARVALLAVLGATWRASYYAPSTLDALRAKRDKNGADLGGPSRDRELWTRCYAAYGLYAFVGLPLLFAPLGPLAVASALANSVLADLATNLHTFAVVGPNHCGDDLPRFSDRPATKGAWYARQIVASANYRTGSDLVDLAHLWLNYQIEHHLFPDAPMLALRRVQPKVKALCERHGLPYVQEPLHRRFLQMARVFLGDRRMAPPASFDAAVTPGRPGDLVDGLRDPAPA